jgi:hypothetical protein
MKSCIFTESEFLEGEMEKLAGVLALVQNEDETGMDQHESS